LEVIIDANVVAGYYKESVLGIEIGLNNNLTASAIPLFDGLGSVDVCYLDDGNMIENEWRAPVSREWFDAWFADLLSTGKAQLITASGCPALEKRLHTNGFPKSRNRDMWYVRVSRAVLDTNGSANIRLFTEDIDFYDPRKKVGESKTRTSILQKGSGPISKLLRKESIIVTALCHKR
jgi:hypothetical protein